jgi:hypothetical protein
VKCKEKIVQKGFKFYLFTYYCYFDFWDTVLLCSSGCTRIWYVARTGLRLLSACTTMPGLWVPFLDACFLTNYWGIAYVPVGLSHFSVSSWLGLWLVFMWMHTLPIHELETRCRYKCNPTDVYTNALSMLSVSFCNSGQHLLFCLLPPKVPWQPEARNRHPNLQFPGQLNSSGN